MTVGARRGGAVLGSPIAHSLSPALHRAAYRALGLRDWTYRAIECDAEALAGVLRGLDAEGLAGVSLTMPLKRRVLPLLARRDRVSEDVGAANTVVFGGLSGEWFGANTDVAGMVAVLRSQGVAGGGEAWVLGAGATAASAVAALASVGFRDVTVAARRPEAAEPVVRTGALLGTEVVVRPWRDVAGCLAATVVVSTTPAGSTDEVASQVTSAAPAPAGLCFDVVYAPWPTPLAAAWQAAGAPVVGGIDLLAEQAALQVELMTGRLPDVSLLRDAGRTALAVDGIG